MIPSNTNHGLVLDDNQPIENSIIKHITPWGILCLVGFVLLGQQLQYLSPTNTTYHRDLAVYAILASICLECFLIDRFWLYKSTMSRSNITSTEVIISICLLLGLLGF